MDRLVTILLMPWGRVGSNLVNGIMALGHDVTVHNEPLTRIDTRGRAGGRTHQQIWDDQQMWLDENIINATSTGPVFLNLAAVHINDPAAFATLMAPCDPTYIVLDRRDVAATVISALRTKAWVDEGAKIGKKRSWAIPKDACVDFRPTIAPKAFLAACQTVENGRKIIANLTEVSGATTYYYEDLMFDMVGVVADIFAKSRITPYRYHVTSGKFGSDTLNDMVANGAQIAQAIIRHAIATRLILPKAET